MTTDHDPSPMSPEVREYLDNAGCTCTPDVQLRFEADGTPGFHLLHEVDCALVLDAWVEGRLT